MFVVESMFLCQCREDFSCLRNILFIFFIQFLIVHGYARNADKETPTQGPLLNNIQREGKVETSNTARGETVTTNKSRVLKTDNLYNSKRPLNVSRQKRSTPLADEDLFEFMVRIANTPVEWERIRRVLSRIKLDEPDNSSRESSSNISVLRIPEISRINTDDKFHHESNNNSRRSTSSVTLPSQLAESDSKVAAIKSNSMNESIESWPSSDWIRKLIKFNVDKEDDYQEVEIEDEENEIYENDMKSLNETINSSRIDKNIIKNNKLPNFVYRRVIPDSKREEESAYIAVSVNSPTDADKNKVTDVLDSTSNLDNPSWFENNYKNVQKLQTRRRHSRRKYDKT